MMPGMAASPLIFEHLSLPEDQFNIHLLEWLIPYKNESISSYASRLLEEVKFENPVLIGVSFGGIIVQEMAKQISVDKLIIISSIKSTTEFPRRMKFARRTGIHKCLPTRLVERMELLNKYNFGIAAKKIKLYNKYLSVNDRRYLDWALEKVVNWQQDKPLPGTIHIHGDSDPVFPIKYIEDCTTIEGGTHVMIINRFRWFNEHLPAIINS